MSDYLDLRQRAEEAWNAWQRPGKTRIIYSSDTTSVGRGVADTVAALEQGIAARGLDVALQRVGSRGLHYMEPVVEVADAAGGHVLYGNVTADRVPALLNAVEQGEVARELAVAVVSGPDIAGLPRLEDLPFLQGQVRRLMEFCGVIDPEAIDHYLAQAGYSGLAHALGMTPEEVIKEMLDSGIWGRGGAAFPAGRKWDFLRTARGEPKYLICNADEGDPGAWVNRMLLECDPHVIIEGMLIAARATGATYGYLYVRDEYGLAVERMNLALAQARERGLLGENILGLGMTYDMEVFRGAGAYVCGDETGLLSSIDDDRGMPRIKPPFPAQAGVHNKPTNVNNVETYANAPLVFRNSVAWYREMGTERNSGTKMFSISGDIVRVGVVEVPFGVPMSTVLLGMGGGVPGGRALKAIQPGGPLSGVIPGSLVDLPLEPEAFRPHAVMMGGGGLTVASEDRCVLDLVKYFLIFCEDESCGRCTTCLGGSQRMVEIFERITSGQGKPSDIDTLQLLAQTLQWSNCAHGQLTPTAPLSAIRNFREELDAHIREKRCPARACPGLINYEVSAQGEGLADAAAICPTGAVVQQGGRYRIDDARCIRCDACREVAAPGMIQVVDRFLPVEVLAAPAR